MKNRKSMSKVFGIALALLLVGAMLPLGALASHSQVEASAATIRVPNNCLTIQAAADTASAGDATIMSDGAYGTTSTYHMLTVDKNGSGTITSNPPGIDCGTDCSELYEEGTWVYLTATADNGWISMGIACDHITDQVERQLCELDKLRWEAVGAGTSYSTRVPIDQARNVTFSFVPGGMVEVSKIGSGTIVSSPSGIDCGCDCREPFFGDPRTVTLTALPGTGATFLGWEGDCSGSGDCTLDTGHHHTDVVARFTEGGQYTLAVNKIGSGTVTSSPAGIDCGSDCSEPYEDGTPVTLTFSPHSGWGIHSLRFEGSCTWVDQQLFELEMLRHGGPLPTYAATLRVLEPETVTVYFVPVDTPIARASDISGQPQVMYPDTEYTVTAKYFDPDGREDLKYCYLRLKHPDKPLTIMWDKATDDFWVYAGEEGENYLTVSGDSTVITDGGLEGYELAWTFTINDQWPEVEDAIDFGVYAWDDADLTSGWDYDSTKASFMLAEALTCVVKLQMDGSGIDEVGIWEFFDIYVGDSTSDIGIEQVRFSSDNVRDVYPTGRWTGWFDWSASSEDWDATTKTKRWAFDTPGYKEVWAQVKDESGHTAFGLATILVPAPALPVLTSPLTITPVKAIYNEGDTLEAEFTIKNIGDVPITLDVLTVGGRLNGFIPPAGAPDFTFRSVTLLPNVPYEYHGSLTLDQMGQYRFFIAYYMENPTQDEQRLLDENNWSTCMELGDGLIHTDRVRSIIVYEEDTVPDDVAQLRNLINSLKSVSTYIPPYLLSEESFGGSVATLWMYWKSFVTDSWEAYDMHYFAGLDYNYLRVKSLILAEDTLDLGNLEQARRLVQMSIDYGKLSSASFRGAFEVYDRNVEQAQAITRFVKDSCQAVVVAGVSAWNPTAGKVLDYAFLCTDYLINRHLLGEEEATKIAVRDAVVKTTFNFAPICDGMTLSDYVKANPAFRFTKLQNYIVNSEILPDIVYDVIHELIVEGAEELAIMISDMLSSAIEYEGSETFSPVELRVRDSEGRITGLIGREVRHEIPGSLYDDGAVMVLFPLDVYCYEMAGTDEGNYGLTITRVEDGSGVMFTATDIPTSVGAVHLYTINWDALSAGEEGVTVQIDSDGDGTFEHTVTSDSELTSDEFVLQTQTVIDFDPNTLNLKSKGKFVTVYIELPEGYDVGQIDIATIRLNDTVLALSNPTEIGDHDEDGVPDLMVKFDRAAVQAVLTVGEEVDVTLTGEVAGIGFKGSDTIRVTNPQPTGHTYRDYY